MRSLLTSGERRNAAIFSTKSVQSYEHGAMQGRGRERSREVERERSREVERGRERERERERVCVCVCASEGAQIQHVGQSGSDKRGGWMKNELRRKEGVSVEK